MPAITLVTLGVSDLDRAIAFYEAWGWTRSSASVEGEVAFLHGQTAALGLFGRDDLAEDANLPAGEPGGFDGVSLAMNLSSKEEVDEVFARAVAAGAEATKEPTDVFWGGYSSYLRDPDGHLWELAWNPGFPLRDDGGIDLPD